MKTFAKCCLSLLALSCFCAPRNSFAEENTKELRVGAVLSLSGPAAIHGLAIREGLEFAKHDLEEKGWRVDLRFQDDGTEARKTLSAVEMEATSGTKLFVGPTWGLLAEPAASVFLRTNSISIQPSNNSEFVKSGGANYFFLLTPLEKYREAFREWLKDKKFERAAIVIADSPWGELHKKIFRQVIEEDGGKIIAEESFQYGAENTAVPALVTKLRAKNPDIILSTSSKEITALLAKHLELQHIQTILLSPDLGDAVHEKLLKSSSPTLQGYFLKPKSQESFLQNFQNWKGQPPKKYADMAYDALMAYADGVSHVGPDPLALKSYFESSFSMNGASGKVRFGTNHDRLDGEYEIVSVIDSEGK